MPLGIKLVTEIKRFPPPQKIRNSPHMPEHAHASCILTQRRARDSNPQPVARHHISSVAASQFAYPPNCLLSIYRISICARINRCSSVRLPLRASVYKMSTPSSRAATQQIATDSSVALRPNLWMVGRRVLFRLSTLDWPNVCSRSLTTNRRDAARKKSPATSAAELGVVRSIGFLCVATPHGFGDVS